MGSISSRGARRTTSSWKRERSHFILLMMIPAIALLAGLILVPFLVGLGLSFTDYILSLPPARFAGFDNYLKLLSSADFWEALRITLVFTVCSVALQTALGLGLAVLLHEETRGVPFLRTVYLLPMAVTPIAAVFTFRMMFNPGLGVFNYMLTSIGLPAQDWLGTGNMAMVSLILLDTWQHTPFILLIIAGGLASLPQDPFEAAKMDGATPWQTFRLVTLPLLKAGATHPWSNAVLPFISQFTELTGIEVETDFRSETEFLTALPIKLAAASPTPDVFMYLAYGQGLTAGWLEPLNAYYGNKDLVDPEWYDEADVLQAARDYPLWSDGERYAFPITAEAQTLYVNKAYLAEKGHDVPRTFEELLAAARACKTDSVAGIAMRAKAAGNATFPLTGFIYSHGGELLKDGVVVYDSPEAIAGVEMFATLLREAGPIGVSNYDWYEALNDFMQGASAITTDSSNFATDISNPDKSRVSDDAAFALFPNTGDKPSIPNMSCWQAAVNSKSANKEAGFLFLLWATSKQTSLLTSARGLATTRVSAWESEGFRKAFGNDAAEAALGNLKNADADLAKRARFHPQSPQILNELAVGASLALSGQLSAAEAMKQAAAKANAQLR